MGDLLEAAGLPRPESAESAAPAVSAVDGDGDGARPGGPESNGAAPAPAARTAKPAKATKSSKPARKARPRATRPADTTRPT